MKAAEHASASNFVQVNEFSVEFVAPVHYMLFKSLGEVGAHPSVFIRFTQFRRCEGISGDRSGGRQHENDIHSSFNEKRAKGYGQQLEYHDLFCELFSPELGTNQRK